MDFPEPSPPEPNDQVLKQPVKVLKKDSDEEAASGGGFAALLQKRAKKMEGSAFRKGLLDSNKQSESEVKWKEVKFLKLF